MGVGNLDEVSAAQFDAERWEKFLKDGDLMFVNIYEYYLKGEAGELTSAEYVKVVDELLADAIAVNAIILPEGYEVADFVLSPAPRGDYPHQQVLEIRFADADLAGGEFRYVNYITGRDKTMSNKVLPISLENIVKGMNGLVGMSKKSS